jgi:cysteine-S-conjugate beta-lyase
MIDNDSLCVHPLKDSAYPSNAATASIHPAVSYNYLNGEELQYPGFFSTYNQKRLGQIMANLERGKSGIVFCSGMAAITTALLTFLRSGDHIIFSRELYGGTLKFATDDLPKRNISCSFAAPELESFSALINKCTRIIYVESPSNPLLNIIALEDLVALAKKHDIITIIDNTFASPINQLPLEMGFDISVESGTKYLGGHNDLPFGTLACNNPEYFSQIVATAKLYGGSLTPNECYLAERSLKTLSIRVRQQNLNAGRIAAYLEKSRYVQRVYYPGLPSHPQHQLAAKQMKGFGGMVSFELDTDEAGIKKFQQNLKVITAALSLGGVESLISSPILTSHRYLSKAERQNLGINDNLLRLSAGIENADDLIEDIDQAITKIH